MNFAKASHHLGSLTWALIFYGVLYFGWYAVSDRAIDKLQEQEYGNKSRD